MSSSYCIYTHTSPSGKVYVGQSKNKEKRWGYNGVHYLRKKGDNSYVQRLFARAIQKYGWKNFKHDIILDDISKSEADYAERYLIRWYKAHGLSYNITEGGEGVDCPRPSLSKERKMEISNFMKEHHPMKGKHHTPEALEKIITANRSRIYTEEQRKKSAEICNKIRHLATTEEARKKMSEYRKKHPELWIGGWNAQEVHQYDLDGKYVTTFHSAMEAAEKLEKDISGDICSCINGNVSSAGGYLWRAEKVDSIDVSKYKIVNTKHGARLYDMSEEGRMKRREAHGKAVNQYTLEGKYLTTFNSITDAAEKTNSNRTGIAKCCKHLTRYKTASGYLWEYDTVENRCDIIKATSKK